MPRLAESSEAKSGTGASSLKRFLKERRRRTSKAILKSHRIHASRGKDLPIRIRPWFLVFTILVIILLGLLGFTNVARGLPVNDKVLHFVCLGVATGLFYWCFEPEEDARRIWFWRNAGLFCTIVVCFFFGAIVSEYVQSLLPYKTFDSGDILANILGCSCGLGISWHLERYYRKRREIARLYTPLDADPDESLSEDELDTLGDLPLYRQTSSNGATSWSSSPLPPSATPKGMSPGSSAPPRAKRRMGDVWDSGDGEELFAVGEEDEDEDDADTVRGRASTEGGKKAGSTA